MTTYQLAKALTQLATALRSMPSMELGEFLASVEAASDSSREPADNPNTAVIVGILARLSRINKSQWVRLIEQWELPIEVPRKDSSRNIMGEVMRYLEHHPEEIRRIQNRNGTAKESRASPALLKALSILMSPDTNEESQSRD